MRILAFATIVGMIGSAIGGLANPPERVPEIRGEGCVEPGVETRCLVVKDVKTGSQFSLFVKGVQPEIGSGIEFIGVPHHGMTTCMAGTAVDVESWAQTDLKCTQGTAPKPRR